MSSVQEEHQTRLRARAMMDGEGQKKKNRRASTVIENPANSQKKKSRRASTAIENPASSQGLCLYFLVSWVLVVRKLITGLQGAPLYRASHHVLRFSAMIQSPPSQPPNHASLPMSPDLRCHRSRSPKPRAVAILRQDQLFFLFICISRIIGVFVDVKLLFNLGLCFLGKC